MRVQPVVGLVVVVLLVVLVAARGRLVVHGRRVVVHVHRTRLLAHPRQPRQPRKPRQPRQPRRRGLLGGERGVVVPERGRGVHGDGGVVGRGGAARRPVRGRGGRQRQAQVTVPTGEVVVVRGVGLRRGELLLVGDVGERRVGGGHRLGDAGLPLGGHHGGTDADVGRHGVDVVGDVVGEGVGDHGEGGEGGCRRGGVVSTLRLPLSSGGSGRSPARVSASRSGV